MRRHADGSLLVTMINHSRFAIDTAIRNHQQKDSISVKLPEAGVRWLVIDPDEENK
jgi:hypothetical protein